MALWTVATTAATVFKIVADSTKGTLKPPCGALRGVLVSDRAKALNNFWVMERRQICWAHLLRKFVLFSERDGPATAIGRELLDYTGLVFEYWHDYKAGKLTRERFIAWMVPVRDQMIAALERATAANIAALSGSCADILEHKAALWTFVDHEGVEPTTITPSGDPCLRAVAKAILRQPERSRKYLRREPDDHRPHRAQAAQERARVGSR
jgi:transposase